MREDVKRLVRQMLQRRSSLSNRDVAEAVDISRQAVHRHLAAMVRSGELSTVGSGRALRYRLRDPNRAHLRLRAEGLTPAQAWQRAARDNSVLSDLSGAADKTVRYAVMQLVENVLVHARSTDLELIVTPNPPLSVTVADYGDGLFETVRRFLGFESVLHAAQELSKGALTTEPQTRRGESLFFLSRLADVFSVESDGLRYTVDNLRKDRALGESRIERGTRVTFTAVPATVRDVRVLRSEMRLSEDKLAKTEVMIPLYAIGTRFASRAEARRLLRGLERYRQVVLDFGGVTEVGQAFADEVFQRWAPAHPAIQVLPVDMCEPVRFVVEQGLYAAR